MMERKFLLVSRIGKESQHKKWIQNSENRNYDVLLSSYDPQVLLQEHEGVYVEYRKGSKVEGYNSLITDWEGFWRKYEYICLMDDDIDAEVKTLNRMFSLCAKHNLKIAQPALSRDSYFSYAGLLQQPQWTLRYTNFVEMMCPIFRCDILQVVRPLFNLGFESGLDLIWCNAVFERCTDFAILDAAVVRHTRPVGGEKDKNGFIHGKRYEDDCYKILEEYGLPWLNCVPYGAMNKSGHITKSRLRFFLAALLLLPSAMRYDWIVYRLRAILVHLNHIRARPARNIKIVLSP